MEECQRYEFEENFVKYFSYIIIFDVGYNSQGRGKIWITFITIMICNFLPKQKMYRRKNAEKLTYYRMYLYAYMVGKISKEKTEGCVKKSKMSSFWDKESCLEQKIYGMMTKWKVRHPIMGIVLCMILGSVLLSLVTEIIIDAIIMML